MEKAIFATNTWSGSVGITEYKRCNAINNIRRIYSLHGQEKTYTHKER